MGRFEDQLFTDLMAEHGDQLATVTRPAPARPGVPRPVWAAAAAVGVAGVVLAGAEVLDDGTPAFAVSRGDDGTVTVSITDISGVDGANAKLRELGIPAVAVPMVAGCTAPQPTGDPGRGIGQVTVDSRNDGDGVAVTFDADGIPAGDTAVLTAKQIAGGGFGLGFALVRGEAPACLPLPSAPAADRSSGSRTGQSGQTDRGGQNDQGGTTVGGTNPPGGPETGTRSQEG